MSNFWKRATTGAVFVLVLVLSIKAGPWSFSLLFLLISTLTLLEFYNLVRLTDHRPQFLTGLVAGAIVYILISFSGLGIIHRHWLWLLLPLCMITFFIELFRKTHQPSGNIGLTILGIMYIPFSFGLLSWIASYSYFEGFTFYRAWPVLGIFILIWSSDTGAYLAGKSFGKHKLFERISPGKTWEGLAGGTILTLAIAGLIGYYGFDAEIRPFQWIGLGIIIQVAGTLGDLAESMLKRSTGIKDSGNILPGHGGLLDRFDAAIAIFPFACAFLYLTT